MHLRIWRRARRRYRCDRTDILRHLAHINGRRMTIHSEARLGFGGDNATTYERTRPGYPAAAVRAIEEQVSKLACFRPQSGEKRIQDSTRKMLIDLGCGTGKFTREMMPFAQNKGIPLLGVEPVEAMRNEFRATLPGVSIKSGVGDDIPVESEAALTIVAAQSFHWMSSSPTLREIHRVLMPGGIFFILWNTRDVKRPWIRALDDIIDPFYGDSVPRQHGGDWRKCFRDLEEQSPDMGKDDGGGTFFGPLAEEHFRHSQWLTLEELEGRVRSISVIATRSEGERQEAVDRARRLAETHPDTAGDLRRHGAVELLYDTEVYWCRKLTAS